MADNIESPKNRYVPVLEHGRKYVAGMELNSLLYFAAFFLVGIALASIGPTIVLIAQNTNSTPETVSVIFPVRSVMYCIGSAIGGVAFDKHPGNMILGVCLVLCGAGMMLVSLVPNILLVSLCLSFSGLAMGVLDTGGNVMLIRVHGSEVAQYMQTMHFLFGLGALASPLIVERCITWFGSSGLAWSFGISGGMFLPCGVMLLNTKSPPLPSNLEHADADTFEGGLEGIFRRLGKGRWVVISATILLLLYVGAEVSYGGYIFLYSTRYMEASEEAGYVLNSLFWGGLTVGRLVAIPWSVVSEPSTILIVDMVGCLFSLALPLLLGRDLTAVWIATAGYGFFMGPIFPTTMTFAEHACTPLTSVGAAIMVLGAAAGEFVWPAMLAVIFATGQAEQGLFWFLPVLEINMMLSLIAYFWMLRLGAAVASVQGKDPVLEREFRHAPFHDEI